MSERASVRAASVLMATLALAGCMSTPAEEDPVQIKLNDLDTRLTRMERATQNQLQVANQLEALRADIRAMHNDIDQLNNAFEASRKQQHDLYADLDQRLKALETRGAGPGPSAAGESQGGGDDKSSYQSAFNFLKDGQYDKAIGALQNFLANYPSSSLADNAQYWLGEAYYVNKDFPNALGAFQKVLDKYPQSRKIPDALLKIGFCRYETKEYESARAALSQVVSQYPDSPAAKLARERLERMSTEKH
jgi:tol-pal system protein YbgF